MEPLNIFRPTKRQTGSQYKIKITFVDFNRAFKFHGNYLTREMINEKFPMSEGKTIYYRIRNVQHPSPGFYNKQLPERLDFDHHEHLVLFMFPITAYVKFKKNTIRLDYDTPRENYLQPNFWHQFNIPMGRTSRYEVKTDITGETFSLNRIIPVESQTYYLKSESII